MKQLTKEEILSQKTTEFMVSNENIPFYHHDEVLTAIQFALDQQTASMYSEDEWIRVEHGLPEIGQVILAVGNGIRANYCQYNNGRFERFIDTISGDRCYTIYYDKITHWQPLPTPPTT